MKIAIIIKRAESPVINSVGQRPTEIKKIAFLKKYNVEYDKRYLWN